MTSATSEETPSFSSDLHTHVWNSYLEWSPEDQGISMEDRKSQPAQLRQGILCFPHGIWRGRVSYRGNDSYRGTSSRKEEAV